MKILHISTFDRGGAANAALRLHKAQLEAGEDSKFLCLYKSSIYIPNVYSFDKKSPSIFLRILRKLGFYNGQGIKNKKVLGKLNGDYEIFTFPKTEFNILNHPLVKEADIINLHWVANFLDWPSFFRGIKKPIVWTLHDMNPFQGGFHYLEDKNNNKTQFLSLENNLLAIKQKSIKTFTNLKIVAPSKWLMQESQNSQLFSSFPHSHIPYSLDLNVFSLYDKIFSRNVFNLPQDKKIILFVSQHTTNKRKGLDLLKEALEQLQSKLEILVIAIGNPPKNKNFFPGVHFLGAIVDERLMAIAYSASDVFVIPSREDNLPNVMLEALACGRPVIGFPIGGIQEIIRPGINGILAKEVSSEAFATAIDTFFKEEKLFNQKKIRQFAEQNFAPKIQSKKYIDLYHKFLK